MNNIDYIIRLENTNEHREVENLVRESFWNVYRPGCLEHYVLNQLRNDPAFVPELDFVMEKDGKLIGHNTDYFGFETMLCSSSLNVRGSKVLVLGSGGASNTVTAVLRDQGADVTVISRSGENNYDNLYLHRTADVIVNTTPVGMYPNVGVSPVDLKQFPYLKGVLDVVYNPARTQLLLDAEEKKITAMNGLLMLVAQAKESAEWFANTTISNDQIQAIHDRLETQMQNIVLIGMPGCGKSTIGTLLAEKLGKRFVDADAYLVEKAGRSIPDIFAADGEPGFRALETKVLAELGKQSGLVIATGGGCVTQARNYPLLHQNGTIFCLNRDLDKLPTDGRPLSQSTKLTEMYRVRKPLYEAFADFQMDNNGNAEATVKRIMEELS